MSRNYRIIFTCIGVLIICLLGATGQASAASTTKLRIAVPHRGLWDTTAILKMGIKQGFFEQKGLDLDLAYTSGGGATIQSVITGTADIAFATGVFGAYAAYAHGAPIRIVSAEFTGGSDVFWFTRVSSGIKSVADLNGKTMSFSRSGSSSEIDARDVAAAAGVHPKFVSSGGMAATRTQVMTGQIAAGWSVPPKNLDLVGQGKARIIATGADGNLGNTTVRVNLAGAKVDPNAVARFLESYQKALDWVYDHKKQAIAYYAKLNHVSLAVAKHSFSFYPKSALQLSKVKNIKKSMALAVKFKRLNKPFTDAQIGKLIQIPLSH